jgi:hypothetical protein
VFDGMRGPTAYVSGQASGDVQAAAEAAGLHVLSASPEEGQYLADQITQFGHDPGRFTSDFTNEDMLYHGAVTGWDRLDVYYRKSDGRFTAMLIRSNDKPR